MTCDCRYPGRTCRLKKVVGYIDVEALVLHMANSPHQRRKARERLEDLRVERKRLEGKCRAPRD